MVEERDPNEKIDNGSGLVGQIVNPNPVELFWEKNKKYLILMAVILAVYIGGYYSYKFYLRSLRNKNWSKLSQTFNLRQLYLPPANPTLDSFGFFYKFSLDNIPQNDVKKIKTTFKGNALGWASFLSAEAFCFLGNKELLGKSVTLLSSKRVPVFFHDEKNSWPELKLNDFSVNEDPTKTKDENLWNGQLAEWDPIGTITGFTARNSSFKDSHVGLFEPPKPDRQTSILFKTSIGDFRVKLFKKQAPQYSENFLNLVEQGFYDGLRFVKIQHNPPVDPRFGISLPSGGDIAWLGNPTTRNENRKKWDLNYQGKTELPFYNNGISHFPYVLAADRKNDSIKSNSEIIYFTGSDCSKERDGGNVVFGVVVDGKDVIRKIINSELSSASEVSSGKGVPKKPVKVLKAIIEK
jgi:cyclophilin family peptidyl-prolyl cis-trans isomerase